MNQKFDVKLELIKCKLCNKVMRTQNMIKSSMSQWGQMYRERGEIEYNRVCNIETRLLIAIPKLTELETNNLIELLDWRSPNRKQAWAFILESQNLRLKQLAGIFKYHYLECRELPNVLSKCYQRFYQSSRKGTIWKTRRAEILKQRGNKCEKCGSTTKLQIHHKKAWYDILDKDLELLCKECHLAKRHGRIFLKNLEKVLPESNSLE